MLATMLRAPEVDDALARADTGDHTDEGDSSPPSPTPRRSRDGFDRLEHWVGLAIVVACCVYVLWQLQPKLLLRNSTITGGDTGAHVWFPDFLIDHFLPWRVAGWSNDFYAGFPAGQFYFPFPAVLIALLDVVLPYNIAFKLVSAIGPVTLPAAAYVFARGIKVPRPGAPLVAVGVTVFMFFITAGDETMTFDLHIMGGNLASTLAGEFSFTIAVSLSMCFLGTFARALDRRGPLWLPALLLALTCLSHLVVAVFAVYAGVVVWLVVRPRKNFTRAAAIAAVGGLLAGFWLLPLAVNLGNTTDMRYEPIGIATGQHYLDWMFPSELWYLYPLLAVAIVAGIWCRRRATLLLVAITVTSGLVFYEWEGLRDLFGKAPAWNLRLLPFWYVALFMLAGLGAAELIRLAALGITWVVQGPERTDRTEPDELDASVRKVEPEVPPPPAAPSPPFEVFTSLAPPEPGTAAQVLAELARAVPSSTGRRRHATRLIAITVLAAVVASAGLFHVEQTSDFLPYWAKYNNTGYETGNADDFTAKSWPEYRAFMDTANSLAPGRMMWEGGDAIGAYGTPLALMLLPYWTHGRIQSMEGLYYEASTTTPYHFMTIATLAEKPSNPVRGLPYKSITDFDLGVRYLQLMGVRYYAAFSAVAKDEAALNPDLKVVRTVPDLDGKAPSGWTIYQVTDSPTVQALRYQPVVVDDLHAAPSWKCEGLPRPVAATSPEAEFSPWECSAVPWFSDPAALERPLTDGGPASWKRAPAATARASAQRPLPEVKVSHVRTTESSVAFDVSRTGVPVMVKTSWYPNWQAEGAEGPWRATPNFMVVVPTSKHVELTFATATVDWVGRALTVVGLVGLGGLVWWGLTTRSGDETGVGSRRRRVRFASRSPR